jgi:hypothetical protein
MINKPDNVAREAINPFSGLLGGKEWLERPAPPARRRFQFRIVAASILTSLGARAASQFT